MKTVNRLPEAGEEYIRRAVEQLRLAEASENCEWCRTHIRELRIACEDLLVLARTGNELAVAGWSRRLGAFMERIGALAVMARLVHMVKGGGSHDAGKQTRI